VIHTTESLSLTSLFIGRKSLGNSKAKVEMFIEIKQILENTYQANYPPAFSAMLSNKTFIIENELDQNLNFTYVLPTIDDDKDEFNEI
jgi:hypothetical protein